MPKIKPVMAWAVLTESGSLHAHSNWNKKTIQEYAGAFADGRKVVRVRISVVQPKRKEAPRHE